MEIAIFAFMENEVKEYYDRLLDACRDDVPLEVAYRQLRELLEQLCRTQMSDGSLQMTDLSARISYVAAKVGLSVVEQNRLHTPVPGTRQGFFQFVQGLLFQLFHQIITIPEMPVKSAPVDLCQSTDLLDGNLFHGFLL